MRKCVTPLFRLGHFQITRGYLLVSDLLSKKRLNSGDIEVWRLCGSIKLWLDARFWSFQVPHVLSKYRQPLCKSEQHHPISLDITGYHWISLDIIGYHWISLALCEFSHKLLCTLVVEHLVGRPMLHSAFIFLILQQDCSFGFYHSPTKAWSYF